MKLENVNFSKRTADEFNILTRLYQLYSIYVLFLPIFGWLFYDFKIKRNKNLEDKLYIVAPNHISYLDVFAVNWVFKRKLAYMAKKELFENPFLRWWLNWLGAFAVDREKLSVSTIRTVLTIKKTDWAFAIFPQGTRQEPGIISNVTKGFASLAKTTKCGIIPVGIVGTEVAKYLPFSGKIIVKIGEMIPYSENVEEMVDKWIESIQELTGFKYQVAV